jgi:hypothetical protein
MINLPTEAVPAQRNVNRAYLKREFDMLAQTKHFIPLMVPWHRWNGPFKLKHRPELHALPVSPLSRAFMREAARPENNLLRAGIEQYLSVIDFSTKRYYALRLINVGTGNEIADAIRRETECLLLIFANFLSMHLDCELNESSIDMFLRTGKPPHLRTIAGAL